jgi:hypothetical protein
MHWFMHARPAFSHLTAGIVPLPTFCTVTQKAGGFCVAKLIYRSLCRFWLTLFGGYFRSYAICPTGLPEHFFLSRFGTAQFVRLSILKIASTEADMAVSKS